jgi:hypothetical protein
MSMIVHVVWVLFTNILLLNLLISMMSETFQTDLEDTRSAVSILQYVQIISQFYILVCLLAY